MKENQLVNFVRRYIKNFTSFLRRLPVLLRSMSQHLFVLSYDIHTPAKTDPKEERHLETDKRYRMDQFLTKNNADEVCKSTYVLSIESSAEKLYDKIMKEVIVEEREGDCIYVAQVVDPRHTREIRKAKKEHERSMKIAGIRK